MDPDLIKEYLHQYDLDARAAGEFRAVQISQEAEQVIHLAESRAKAQGHPNVEPEDILRGILDAGECAASQMLLSLEADPEELRRELGGVSVPVPAAEMEGEARESDEQEENMMEKIWDGCHGESTGRRLRSDDRKGRCDREADPDPFQQDKEQSGPDRGAGSRKDRSGGRTGTADRGRGGPGESEG